MRCHDLEIFRNCAYEYPLSLVDAGGFPEGLYGWQFALVIGATNTNRTFGPAVITDTTPVIGSSGSSTVTFILSAEETAILMIGTAYEFLVVAQPPGYDQGVLEYGNVRVRDAPLIF
jgi:hypothetical protein